MPVPQEDGASLHLLADSHAVQTVTGLYHRVEPPRRRSLSPVLVADQPGEGRRLGRIVVLPDAGTGGLRAWYIANIQGRSGDGVLCSAVSTDGLSWAKPAAGQWRDHRVYSPQEWGAAQGRTASQFEFSGVFECTGVVADPTAPPAERYKALFYFKDRSQEVNGFWLATSPDGSRWQRRPEAVIPREGDDSRIMWDPWRRRWLFTCRRHRMYADTRSGRPWKRTISLAESADCIHWSTLAPILKPDDDDPPDAQFYNMLIVSRAGLYLGFMSVYHTAVERMDVQLAVSRDLRHWERPGRRAPFFEPGPLGSWDDRLVHLAHSAPCAQGERLLWWYSGSTTGHGAPRREGAIGALEMERDRFIGWVAGIRPGELVTEPLRLSATRLLVNVAASMGELRVELLDEVGGPPDGYSLEDCDPLAQRDSTDAEVTWGGQPLPDEWVGRMVRLRFRLAYGSLFGFRFGAPARLPGPPTGSNGLA